jgi:hypothetical protein
MRFDTLEGNGEMSKKYLRMHFIQLYGLTTLQLKAEEQFKSLKFWAHLQMLIHFYFLLFPYKLS